jgi:general secretion pathway protein M
MNVRDWFDNLNERERNLVYVAGALVGIALVYLVLVLPFQMSGKKMTARVAQKTADLAWMQASAPQAMAAAGVAQTGGGGLGTSLRDQSPDGNNGLRLRIEGASFDALVTWLANLQQQYGVSIESATVGAAAPGLVNATLSLKQAGAAG